MAAFLRLQPFCLAILTTTTMWEPVALSEDTDHSAEAASQLPSGAVALLGGGDFLNRVSNPDRIAMSPNGQYIATASLANFGSVNLGLEVWDAKTGKSIGPKSLRKADITSVAWSPDSRQLLIGRQDHESHQSLLEIRDFKTGKVNRIVANNEKNPFDDVDWSQDGRWIAAGPSEGPTRVWETKTYKSIWSFKETCWRLDFSPDSQNLAIGRDSVTIYDLATGKPSEKWKLPRALNHVFDVTFRPDNQELAIASDEGTALWNPGQKQFRSLVPQNPSRGKGINSLRYFDQGKYLAVVGFNGNRCDVWDIATGKESATIRGPSLFAVDALPQAKKFVMGTHRLVFADAKGHIDWPKAHVNGIGSLQILPGNQLFSVGRTGRLHVWDLKTFRHVRSFSPSGETMAASVSPHQSTVIVAGGPPAMVESRNFDSGKLQWKSAELYSPKESKLRMMSVVHLSDEVFVTGEVGPAIRFWDREHAKTGSKPPRIEIPCEVHALDTKFEGEVAARVLTTPDTKHLVVWTVPNTTVSLFDAEKRKCLWSTPLGAGFVPSVAVDPQNRWLAVGMGTGIAFLEFETGQLIAKPPFRCKDMVFAVAVSPSGNQLAASLVLPIPDQRLPYRTKGKVLRVWSMRTGKLEHEFEGHPSITQALTFAADGKRLISGNNESYLTVWDLTEDRSK